MLLARLTSFLRQSAIQTGPRILDGKFFLSPNVIRADYQWYRQKSLGQSQTDDVRPETGTNNETKSDGASGASIKAKQLFLKTGDTSSYHVQMSSYLRAGNVKEALAVLNEDMLQKDRVMPDATIFALLMNECARLGFARKCMQLYKLMGECNHQATEENLTAMMSACVNTPFRKHARTFALDILEIIKRDKIHLTQQQYELLIQALAKGGASKDALGVLHMAEKMNSVSSIDIYKMLLHAVSENKESGFRDAVVVWHRMHQFNRKPDIYTFHLLLKCVSDCSLGDVKEAQRIFEAIVRRNALEGAEGKTPTESTDVKLTDELNAVDHRPNMLSKTPQLAKLLPLEKVITASDRMLLLGGLSSFFAELKNHGAEPTLGTFLQLAAVVPSTIDAMLRLLVHLRQAGVEPDIILFNLMLKRVCVDASFEEATRLMKQIGKSSLMPNMESLTLLAITCKTTDEMNNLLEGMEAMDLIPTMFIYEAFTRNLCQQKAFNDIISVLHLVKDAHLKVNNSFVNIVDQFCADYAKNHLIGKRPKKEIVVEYEIFARKYRRWKRDVGAHTSESRNEKDSKAHVEIMQESNQVSTSESKSGKIKFIQSHQKQAGELENMRNWTKNAPRNGVNVAGGEHVHCWQTFERNVVPDGVDVSPGQPSEKKKQRKRRRRSDNTEKNDESGEIISESKARYKYHLKRNPPPPRSSTGNK